MGSATRQWECGKYIKAFGRLHAARAGLRTGEVLTVKGTRLGYCDGTEQVHSVVVLARADGSEVELRAGVEFEPEHTTGADHFVKLISEQYGLTAKDARARLARAGLLEG